jgi:hypothetical protein
MRLGGPQSRSGRYGAEKNLLDLSLDILRVVNSEDVTPFGLLNKYQLSEKPAASIFVVQEVSQDGGKNTKVQGSK